MIRAVGAALAAAGLLWAGCVPAHADAVAPPGGADAAGLRVAPLDTCVSCTSASAAPDHTGARATALRLLGNDVAGGASQDGAARRGSLAALPSNAVLDLAVLSWDTGTETGGPPASQSRTALLDAGLLPAGEDSTTGGLVTVAVLESFSDATHSGARSGGYGAANGADIGLANGAVVIILLHSQATTDSHDNAYLVSVAGESAGGTAGDTPGTPVSVPGLLDLTLLRASASGGGSGDAAVGSVDGLLGQLGPGRRPAHLRRPRPVRAGGHARGPAARDRRRGGGHEARTRARRALDRHRPVRRRSAAGRRRAAGRPSRRAPACKNLTVLPLQEKRW